MLYSACWEVKVILVKLIFLSALKTRKIWKFWKGFWWSGEITFSWPPLPKSRDNHANNWANEIRQRFTEYLSKKGFAPWQWKYAQFDLWELMKQLTEPAPREVLIKKCSANMLQIYRRTPMQRVIFIKILSCLLHICRTPLKNASGELLLVTSVNLKTSAYNR